MSGNALRRMTALSGVLERAEKATAAQAAAAAADAERAEKVARNVTARAAAAKARSGELHVFLASRSNGAALAAAAEHAEDLSAAAVEVLERASAQLSAQRIQLKAVQRMADARRREHEAHLARVADLAVQDAVTARYAARAGRA